MCTRAHIIQCKYHVVCFGFFGVGLHSCDFSFFHFALFSCIYSLMFFILLRNAPVGQWLQWIVEELRSYHVYFIHIGTQTWTPRWMYLRERVLEQCCKFANMCVCVNIRINATTYCPHRHSTILQAHAVKHFRFIILRYGKSLPLSVFYKIGEYWMNSFFIIQTHEQKYICL